MCKYICIVFLCENILLERERKGILFQSHSFEEHWLQNDIHSFGGQNDVLKVYLNRH